MTRIVLLVRARQELTDTIEQQFKEKFGDVEFIDVEPLDPTDLLNLCQKHDVAAVALRENPLPVLAMEAGIPCIPIRHGHALQRLVSVELLTEPL